MSKWMFVRTLENFIQRLKISKDIDRKSILHPEPFHMIKVILNYKRYWSLSWEGLFYVLQGTTITVERCTMYQLQILAPTLQSAGRVVSRLSMSINHIHTQAAYFKVYGVGVVRIIYISVPFSITKLLRWWSWSSCLSQTYIFLCSWIMWH